MALCTYKVDKSRYTKSGLRSFGLRVFTLIGGSPVYPELLPGRVDISLIGPDGNESQEFSSEDGSLILGQGGVKGLITFSQINSWDMMPGSHIGRIVHTDDTGFVTVLREIRFDFI